MLERNICPKGMSYNGTSERPRERLGIPLEKIIPLVTTPQVVSLDKLRYFHKPENISQNAVKEFLLSCQMANPSGKWIEFIPVIIFLSIIVLIFLFLPVGKRSFRRQKPNNLTRRQKTYFRRLCIQYP